MLSLQAMLPSQQCHVLTLHPRSPTLLSCSLSLCSKFACGGVRSLLRSGLEHTPHSQVVGSMSADIILDIVELLAPVDVLSFSLCSSYLRNLPPPIPLHNPHLQILQKMQIHTRNAHTPPRNKQTH
ncbi:hypothetical protein BDQ17DRAFT_461435 [Cyathus striatus]|nr:hypothetical protein BDQ17DRAFT_461435 [Cyathus striatus]